MDLTRFAVDAGQFINRAIQYTGESIGQAEKTELDPAVEELLSRAEATKTWTDRIIAQTEVLLQPNPGARLEDRLYEHLDWTVPPRPRTLEVLGNEMTQAGLEIGSNTPYGTALLRCGDAQKQLSDAERKFVQSTNIHFLRPLRCFTEVEYSAVQDARRALLNKRLDLDIAKSRLRKAHEAEREDRNLGANPVDDDYVSHVSYMFSFLRVKWLKIWAQQISQAEMELSVCQSLFDRQLEISRRTLEGTSDAHSNHMRSLTDFVDTQASYFDQCSRQAQELQKQLGSVPAVLRSNSWLSEVGPRPTAEPGGSNEATSLPAVVVNQLPDFDQDSWTLCSPPGAEMTPVHSSGAARAPELTNNYNYNNNNNNAAAAAAARHFHISTSNPDNRLPEANVAASSESAEAALSNQTVNIPPAAAGTTDAGNETTQSPYRPWQVGAAVDDAPTAADAGFGQTGADITVDDAPTERVTDFTVDDAPTTAGFGQTVTDFAVDDAPIAADAGFSQTGADIAVDDAPREAGFSQRETAFTVDDAPTAPHAGFSQIVTDFAVDDAPTTAGFSQRVTAFTVDNASIVAGFSQTGADFAVDDAPTEAGFNQRVTDFTVDDAPTTAGFSQTGPDFAVDDAPIAADAGFGQTGADFTVDDAPTALGFSQTVMDFAVDDAPTTAGFSQRVTAFSVDDAPTAADAGFSQTVTDVAVDDEDKLAMTEEAQTINRSD